MVGGLCPTISLPQVVEILEGEQAALCLALDLLLKAVVIELPLFITPLP